MEKLQAQDKVEICSDDTYIGSIKDHHICFGVVERLTTTLIIVRNEHGNICRFRRSDGQQVGYSYPHATEFVRKA